MATWQGWTQPRNSRIRHYVLEQHSLCLRWYVQHTFVRSVDINGTDLQPGVKMCVDCERRLQQLINLGHLPVLPPDLENEAPPIDVIAEQRQAQQEEFRGRDEARLRELEQGGPPSVTNESIQAHPTRLIHVGAITPEQARIVSYLAGRIQEAFREGNWGEAIRLVNEADSRGALIGQAVRAVFPNNPTALIR